MLALNWIRASLEAGFRIALPPVDYWIGKQDLAVWIYRTSESDRSLGWSQASGPHLEIANHMILGINDYDIVVYSSTSAVHQLYPLRIHAESPTRIANERYEVGLVHPYYDASEPYLLLRPARLDERHDEFTTPRFSTVEPLPVFCRLGIHQVKCDSFASRSRTLINRDFLRRNEMALASKRQLWRIKSHAIHDAITKQKNATRKEYLADVQDDIRKWTEDFATMTSEEHRRIDRAQVMTLPLNAHCGWLLGRERRPATPSQPPGSPRSSGSGG